MVIRQNASGYSLYELIITVGIAALLMSLSVPSYGKMLANHHLKVEVDAIFHAVHLAPQGVCGPAPCRRKPT